MKPPIDPGNRNSRGNPNGEEESPGTGFLETNEETGACLLIRQDNLLPAKRSILSDSRLCRLGHLFLDLGSSTGFGREERDGEKKRLIERETMGLSNLNLFRPI